MPLETVVRTAEGAWLAPLERASWKLFKSASDGSTQVSVTPPLLLTVAVSAVAAAGPVLSVLELDAPPTKKLISELAVDALPAISTANAFWK